MSPAFPCFDLRNHLGRYIVPGRNFHGWHPLSEQHLNLYRLTPVQLVEAGSQSASRNAIPSVVEISSNSQMLRVNTQAIVTGMKHQQASRYRPIGNLPRKPMGAPHFPVLCILSIPNAAGLANCSCGPIPAFIGAALIDLRPKSIDILLFCSHGSPSSAVLVRPVCGASNAAAGRPFYQKGN